MDASNRYNIFPKVIGSEGEAQPNDIARIPCVCVAPEPLRSLMQLEPPLTFIDNSGALQYLSETARRLLCQVPRRPLVLDDP